MDAQFSYQYAIANALLRARPRLDHFVEPRMITEPAVGDLARRLRAAGSGWVADRARSSPGPPAIGRLLP